MPGPSTLVLAYEDYHHCQIPCGDHLYHDHAFCVPIPVLVLPGHTIPLVTAIVAIEVDITITVLQIAVVDTSAESVVNYHLGMHRLDTSWQNRIRIGH